MKKCVNKTINDKTDPIAVAKPAPKIPISNTNVKKMSPKILKIPPIKTPNVAAWGSLSFLKKEARSWLN